LRRFIPAILAAVVALGAGPAAAQGGMTLRDKLVIVSSSSSAGLSTLLARAFAERFPAVPAPATEAIGSARALDRFCAGIGPQSPDIALSTRRMPRTMLETCAINGVRDIVEVQLGYGAVVLATRRGDPVPPLTSRQVWAALAAEQPVEDEFLPNRARFWSDAGPGLPRNEIRVILPAAGSGIRALFDDLVMEAGCRQVREIRLLFEAAYRHSKCVTLRSDPGVRALPSADIPSALLAAPPGTIAVMSYDQLVASGGNFVALNLDGTVPTPATIASDDYDQSRVFYLYAKRQHSRNSNGVGVVRGIHEFLAEATSEQAVGPGGYLTAAGLVPLGPADRAAQRRVALRLTPMSR
jgi:phosphate transport system substrate-binding protein